MIKAYHMVGSDSWKPSERIAALREIMSVGEILPATDRFDRHEMEAECFTGEDRGSTIQQNWGEATPNALKALRQIAREKIDELPESGLTGGLFNCTDLIAGDLGLIFLSPGDWYTVANGFVFDAQELLEKGARFRPNDLLGDYSAAISAAVRNEYSTVADAREAIEAMIDDVHAWMEFSGDKGYDTMKRFEGHPTHQEIVWPGPLPVSMAIEVWQEGKQIKPTK